MARILCIDDDPSTAPWVEMVLSNAGIDGEVVAVTTGKQGFNELMGRGGDLCILDYALPDMTGVQLCTLMRQTGCNVPMIFFSAMNRPVDRERAARAKANAYLSKPEDLDIFLPTVLRLLNAGEPEAAQFPEFAQAA
jgi:CheY-like chemotaxis protein